MSMIDITNVVNVSVAVPPAGLAPYSVNNLACFTKETPVVALSGDYAAYTNPSAVKAQWGSGSKVYAAALAVFSQSPNILTGGGLFIAVPVTLGVVGGTGLTGPDETFADAIERAADLVYFGGCSYTWDASAEIEDAADVCQTLGKLLFVTSSTEADLLTSGLFYDIQDQGLTYTRCLFHTASAQLDAFRWGYAGRAMSTNFAGSNVAGTMHLKTLVGVSSDIDLTQTMLLEADAVGADVYVNIAGQSCVLSYGANSFFDDVYNLMWMVSALQVSGFNFLRQTSTKIPQTEAGMDGLKGAYRAVCRAAVTNGFLAAGTWTGSDTFGDPEDFHRNIADFGFYVYSAPVALQAAADRAERIAPVVQIALKYAGAIHSSSVIVQFNP